MKFLLIVIYAGATGWAEPQPTQQDCWAAKEVALQADDTEAFCIIQAEPDTEFVAPEDLAA
ncbi:hypothetical protein [Paracoccus litorisediminis]|uniref:Uncharacterized protein n=1 Tax=Paracoccus litorisediminis TaxID=2006130 RepID=A0A844HPY9_9RHOB|nr:hypothetical protein [Paracoccus litorisediminis]MTH61128.1 hypothetical protein [Paracoccus litorisediminis]